LYWSIFFALYLGGRTYFIVLMIALLIRSMKLAILFGFFTALFIWVYYLTDASFYGPGSHLVTRFMDAGINSPRFMLWLQGLEELATRPFGGFEVDRTIDDVAYFHNVWIDFGRIAGWVPVLIFAVLNILVLALGICAR